MRPGSGPYLNTYPSPFEKHLKDAIEQKQAEKTILSEIIYKKFRINIQYYAYNRQRALTLFTFSSIVTPMGQFFHVS